MGCMKCGKKLGTSHVFCDECLEKMAQCPVKPGTVVKLPQRPAVTKKKPARRRYLWNAEDEIDVLRSKIRWLRFALIVAIIGFLLSTALVFVALNWQGRLDIINRLFLR